MYHINITDVRKIDNEKWNYLKTVLNEFFSFQKKFGFAGGACYVVSSDNDLSPNTI